jgi:hypothetical protein
MEAADKFSCLRVTLESTEGWNKQKTLAKTQGYRTNVAIGKCISVSAKVKAQMLETIQHVLCIMHGTEVWGLSQACKELYKVHNRYCKKLMGTPEVHPTDLLRWNLAGRGREASAQGRV